MVKSITRLIARFAPVFARNCGYSNSNPMTRASSMKHRRTTDTRLMTKFRSTGVTVTRASAGSRRGKQKKHHGVLSSTSTSRIVVVPTFSAQCVTGSR